LVSGWEELKMNAQPENAFIEGKRRGYPKGL